MDAAPVVVAFSDSRAVRETLSVLLEHECALRFVNASSIPPPDPMLADLAVVALRHSSGVVHDLIRRWPTMPIVTVQFPEAAPPLLAPPARVASVPLDPHAIRAAVRHNLSDALYVPLSAVVRSVAEALRAEVAYPLATLRSCASVWVSGSGADAHLVLAMVRQQSALIAQAIEDLDRFLLRPREVHNAPDFALTLCHEIERPAAAPTERTLVYESIVSASLLHDTGPVSLIPLLVTFLRAHLGRRCDAPLVRLSVEPDGVLLRYPPRAAPGPTPSWPLLLAALAVKPWGWRVVTVATAGEETVRLCPA